MTTELTALADEQVRAVRDDRSAIADGLYRLLETPLNGVELRKAVFAYISALHAEAMTESIIRIALPADQKDTST